MRQTKLLPRRALLALCLSLVIVFQSHAGTFLQDYGPVLALDWSPDGTALAIAYSNGRLETLDVTTNEILFSFTHPDGINDIAWNPESPTLMAVAFSNGTMTIVNMIEPGTAIQFDPVLGVAALEWSPDGSMLASTSRRNSLVTPLVYTVNIWNATTGELIRSLEGEHTDTIIALSWSPEGTQLATGSTDSTVVIWNVATGLPEITLPVKQLSVNSVSWSASGERIATSSYDFGDVNIWDSASGQLVGTYPVRYVSEIAYSPLGELLAIADGETLSVIDTAEGTVLETIKTELIIIAVDWSPTGTLTYGGERGSIHHLVMSSTASQTPAETLTLTPAQDQPR